ncbi:hypothetical protein A8A54_15475 [Brucella pseudogrignonensis]|uniref:hypothetical protein n=1 Tax=Brucella pseudogrignonensis TaxID=419475 RepID=UPI0007DA9028|nr:hypothetical protein [Brucella pseudogrignonensis]ANG97757.1 hypothetical protein A8A54_15475 [Brucella pseudogrignonensis]
MEFIVKDITKFDIESGITGGKVEFNLPDKAGDVEVLQGISVDLRIQIHDDLTLSQIEEMLLKKAMEQLHAVVSNYAGKPAHELRVQSEQLSLAMLSEE